MEVHTLVALAKCSTGIVCHCRGKLSASDNIPFGFTRNSCKSHRIVWSSVVDLDNILNWYLEVNLYPSRRSSIFHTQTVFLLYPKKPLFLASDIVSLATRDSTTKGSFSHSFISGYCGTTRTQVSCETFCIHVFIISSTNACCDTVTNI